MSETALIPTPEAPDVPYTRETKLIRLGSRGVQLASFEDAFRFGKAVVASGMAPQAYRRPEQVLVAIQYGAELGLPPLQSLQAIAVINGRPVLWGDALPALVWSSGKCEDICENFDGEEGTDTFAAVCKVKRSGQAEHSVRRFSVADAKSAKLWGKAGPWTQYPKRMLQIRARAWAFRDTFADVLSGFSVAEEVDDYEQQSRRIESFEDQLQARVNGCETSEQLAALMATVEAIEPPLSEAAMSEFRMYADRRRGQLGETAA